MAEWLTGKASRALETKRPPLTAEQFEATPEFRKFKRAMREILKISKKDLDERVRHAKVTSPRVGNPNAPGRKKGTAVISPDKANSN